VNAANEPGEKPVVQILEYPQRGLAERVQVPAISVNVYEFEVV
jgi:hypothetical protein